MISCTYLALIAVGQEHHETRLTVPLDLGRSEEVVDDDLSAVDEVAELGLPQRKLVRVVERVAVLSLSQ